jgi:hypothetical protein
VCTSVVYTARNVPTNPVLLTSMWRQRCLVSNPRKRVTSTLAWARESPCACTLVMFEGNQGRKKRQENLTINKETWQYKMLCSEMRRTPYFHQQRNGLCKHSVVCAAWFWFIHEYCAGNRRLARWCWLCSLELYFMNRSLNCETVFDISLFKC